MWNVSGPSDIALEPPIDQAQLLNRVMGNASLASRLLDKFVAAGSVECDLMESAARMGDHRQLASMAHRHKGTAATMAAPRIMATAAALEQAAAGGDTPQWLHLIEQLRLLHGEVLHTLSTASHGRSCPSVQGERQ